MKKYLSVLSVFSCLAVVILHTNSVFWTFSYDSYWWKSNLVESAFYFAVPIFFMISGCNLIDYNKKYNTKVYFLKRIRKTVVPFLLWSIIGYGYLIVTGLWAAEKMEVKKAINLIFNSSIIGPYWFFIPLFAIYITIPAVAMVPEHSRKSIFEYLLTVGFAINMVLPLAFKLVGLEYNSSFYISMSGGYFFYALAGYYIDRYPIGKKYRILAYILGISGVLAQAIGTYILSYRDGTINQLYKGYLNVPTVFYAIAIFLLFKSIDTSRVIDRMYRIMKWVSEDTFGIYLIHWYIIAYIQYHTQLNIYRISYWIGGGIIIFVISALLTKIIRRIPIIKNLIP